MSELSARPELKAYFAKGYWACQCPGYLLRRPEQMECPVCMAKCPTAAVGTTPPASAPAASAPPQKPNKGPNKTEAEAKRRFCPGDARYEGLTFVMASGHRYTPDFCWWVGDRLHCLEVKGSYKLGSYGRAKLAFDQCKVEFACVSWIWAERQKDGSWRVQK